MAKGKQDGDLRGSEPACGSGSTGHVTAVVTLLPGPLALTRLLHGAALVAGKLVALGP